ncbi:NAD(P)-binding protein [Basidiobolus meristosporus CBS 931.73]|uniref:NAD(P)-binding protein n=1 Tax=Basidiobolus meristosporus CBS 931.73 TaxID=1314790 RepID=A0A1Y1ZDR1_9FUNG|nr:NAD(P)-binding protein [Basidiobolus meristosporus CBS 931.73]|eukprot:ORY08097.1 NAD(P)-binding protein [Basidiobolus meristosporus CBS 931.73]
MYAQRATLTNIQPNPFTIPRNYGFDTAAEEAAAHFPKEIEGKIVLVTGCSLGGLGAECCRAIAKHKPGLLILTGRRQEALTKTIEKIKPESVDAILRSLTLDLASLDSVRGAAEEVNGYKEHIDVLINNAAVYATKYETTKNDFGLQFGTNHLGYFWLTNLIMVQN